MIKNNDYFAGFQSKETEILKTSFISARNNFNNANPIGLKYETIQKLRFAQGEFDALLKHKGLI